VTTRLLLASAVRDVIGREARAAFPEECCGLLLGLPAAEVLTVTRAHPTRNLAADRRRTFEVDFAERLKLQRELAGAPEDVVGMYHSHPGAPARPSAADLAQAWEPGWLWLIAAVDETAVTDLAAYRYDWSDEAEGRFTALAISHMPD